MSKRKRPSADQVIEEFERYKSVESERAAPVYREGQILGGAPGAQNVPACTRACSFKNIVRDYNSVVYVCCCHRRVHVCGEACCEKILSHENWSCPFTGEVVGFVFCILYFVICLSPCRPR